MKPYLLPFAIAIGTALTAPTALAQSIATVQDIQAFPLAIEAPYTTFTSSQPAVVTLETSQPISITISPPVASGFSDPAGTQLTSFIRSDAQQMTHGTPLLIDTVGTVQVDVSMEAVRPQPYPPGNYLYTVVLTIAPQ